MTCIIIRAVRNVVTLAQQHVRAPASTAALAVRADVQVDVVLHVTEASLVTAALAASSGAQAAQARAKDAEVAVVVVVQETVVVGVAVSVEIVVVVTVVTHAPQGAHRGAVILLE
jgi:hypothetical protein